MLKMRLSRGRKPAAKTASGSRRKCKKADGFDCQAFLLSLNQEVAQKTNDEVLVENASEHSVSYTHHQCSIVRSFLQTLASKGESFLIVCCTFHENPFSPMTFLFVTGGKWDKLLALVKRSDPTGSKDVELIFEVLSGPVTAEKKAICNAAMVDWQVNVKKKKVPLGGCPFYSPASTNTNLRVFFATCKSQHDWHLCLEDVSGYPGSLAGVLKVLYEKRSKEWVSLLFFSAYALAFVILTF